MTWPEIDDRLPRSEVEAHHARCLACRSLYEAAQRVGRSSALEVWRREFWACRQRDFWQRYARRRRPATTAASGSTSRE